MEKWIKEIVEQVCIGQVLLDSKLESGNRLALITVDNAVEFALKFHASHERLLRPNELNSNDAFFRIIDLITPSKISVDDAKDIKQYHNHRNTLYHGAQLTTVQPRLVIDYIAMAKKLFISLFQYSATEKVWATQVNQVRKALVRDVGILETVIFEEKTVDSLKLVQMKVTSTPMTTESILLAIHGYNTIFARSPTSEELERSLKLSGVPITNQSLMVNVSQQRNAKNIERDSLTLKSAAIDKLKKRYLF